MFIFHIYDIYIKNLLPTESDGKSSFHSVLKATLPFFWEIILMDASPNITVNISRHANVASIFGNTQCQSSWTSQPLYSTIELRDKNALASLLSSYCYIIQTTVVVGETFSISLYILKLYSIFEPFNRLNNTP